MWEMSVEALRKPLTINSKIEPTLRSVTNSINLMNNINFDNFDSLEFNENAEVEKVVQPIFLLIDTSTGMSKKIEDVRLFVEKLKNLLHERNIAECDIDKKLSILCFSDTPRWEAFMQEPLKTNSELSLGSLLYMGSAFSELLSKLSIDFFNKTLGKNAGIYRHPLFVLINNRYSSDDVESSINKLKQNRCFNTGNRIAIALKDNANHALLEQFTGSPHTVIRESSSYDWQDVVLNFVEAVIKPPDNCYGSPYANATNEACFELSARTSVAILVDSLSCMVVNNNLSQEIANGIVDLGFWELC